MQCGVVDCCGAAAAANSSCTHLRPTNPARSCALSAGVCVCARAEEEVDRQSVPCWLYLGPFDAPTPPASTRYSVLLLVVLLYCIGEDGELRWGAAGMQGWRTGMEDSHLACLDLNGKDSTTPTAAADPAKKIAAFAVFDGHVSRKKVQEESA